VNAEFDRFVETACKPYYSENMGTKSVPPGRYFRMHLVGYFEGIDSERGIEWRCSDPLSLRDFLLLEAGKRSNPRPHGKETFRGERSVFTRMQMIRRTTA
jgi:transposase